MAGFHRLCGRFCCVGWIMSQNGTEGAKFKHLQRLWGVVLVGRQGGKSRGQRAHAHEWSSGGGWVFKGVYWAIKWPCLRLALRWLKQGWRSGRKSARFVLKMGLEILLGILLGVLWRYNLPPPTDKNSGKNGDFWAINTPFNSKICLLKRTFKGWLNSWY